MGSFRFLLAALALNAGAAETGCFETLPQIPYVTLAKQARIQGDVVLTLNIAAGGSPEIRTLEGHPLLTSPVAEAVRGASLGSRCSGAIRVTYRFVIEPEQVEPELHSVTQVSPDEFRLTTSIAPELIVCGAQSRLSRPSWIKRLFSR